ncbi:hypothetical protein VH1709_contig00013-0001 [Vibrio harveyi]|nr:hypothetical protein VH1709_contig00013-0001 [Vibrio harveyi]
MASVNRRCSTLEVAITWVLALSGKSAYTRAILSVSFSCSFTSVSIGLLLTQIWLSTLPF